jgi:asparagine synthase (glutamine-hydrolysing)
VCGIAGIVSVGQPDAALERRVCDVLAHRGADGDGHHQSRARDAKVRGHRRGRGQQPVYNEDRTVAAVFNGKIYNFAELRAELRRGPTRSPMSIFTPICQETS